MSVGHDRPVGVTPLTARSGLKVFDSFMSRALLQELEDVARRNRHRAEALELRRALTLPRAHGSRIGEATGQNPPIDQEFSHKGPRSAPAS